MALHEQARDLQGFSFIETAAKEELLQSLESLAGSIERKKESVDNQETTNDARAKRAEGATRMREQAMMKM
uniref:FH2 domain-containing protein n=1 Tax=Angiostrongylus cantonensis TaxID=6313 RepID=A0A0K0DJE4_ANGCA